jgi:hypothetical protein
VEEMKYLILLISIFLVRIAVKFGYRLQLFKSKKHAALTRGSLFITGSTLDSYALIRGYWTFQQRNNAIRFRNYVNNATAIPDITAYDAMDAILKDRKVKELFIDYVRQEFSEGRNPRMLENELLPTLRAYMKRVSDVVASY